MKKKELLSKSREAMLSAVQIYNNPQIQFKSESFITLSIISWTYLLHTYYSSINIDFRYHKLNGKRKKYERTKHGAYKHWELERCLNDSNCPLDFETTQNLKFLIGVRHEIEHQMTRKIDDTISAKLQSCSINYNYYIKKMFGNKFALDSELGLAIQFAPILEEQKGQLLNNIKLPNNMKKFVMQFENDLEEDVIRNERYAYRVVFAKLNVNRANQADKVVEFIRPDSPFAEGLNKEYRVIKETERKKHIPSQVVKKMHDLGYKYFTMRDHTILWKKIDTSTKRKILKQLGYGTFVAGKQWMWYESWLKYVEEYCKCQNEALRYNTNNRNNERGFLPSEVVSEVNRHSKNSLSPRGFVSWRKEKKIYKEDMHYGMYNIQGQWMWKQRIIDLILKEY